MTHDNTLNGSDHRAAILYLDTEIYLGMDPPRAIKDNIEVRIQDVTSALERGEHSNVTQAHMDKIYAVLETRPERGTSRNGSTVGMRVKDANAAYEEAKSSKEGVPEATSALSGAIDNFYFIFKIIDHLLRDATTPLSPPRWTDRF